jgi:CheY-like chemotaxis protein
VLLIGERLEKKVSELTHSAPRPFADDRICVLLADDDPVFAMVAEAKLREAGFVVTRVGDGAIARYLVEAEPVDAIVTDLEMPFLDGEGLIETLGSTGQISDIPVYVVTAAPELRRIRSCLAKKVQLYMHKPIDWSFLVSEIRFAVMRQRGVLSRIAA